MYTVYPLKNYKFPHHLESFSLYWQGSTKKVNALKPFPDHYWRSIYGNIDLLIGVDGLEWNICYQSGIYIFRSLLDKSFAKIQDVKRQEEQREPFQTGGLDFN